MDRTERGYAKQNNPKGRKYQMVSTICGIKQNKTVSDKNQNRNKTYEYNCKIETITAGGEN